MSRTFDANIVEVRSTGLDTWMGKRITHTRRSRRNAVVHGGNILADDDVIRQVVDQRDSRAGRWKPAFESHYNVSWDLLHSRGGLDSASKEVVQIFDYLANTRSLEKWEDRNIQVNTRTSSEKFKDHAEIEEFCTSWIEKWVSGNMGTNPTKAQMERLRQLSHQE
ncbi:hypothetical protein N7535_007667 [Penicillium sp. DV-2018c]|nr:hypothetical protein N7461_003697 [Penicillium sp. DV-2018c]KAJ5566029.1 hypothetical protein N7535_007667 [Penicillium sp. DV-2018c]